MILDATALLAYLFGERGGDRVSEVLKAGGSGIGIVNWSEVLSKIAERGGHPELVARALRRAAILDMDLVVLPLDERTAFEIAHLRPLTRKWGLGIGDRACIALARGLSLPILTADGDMFAARGAAGVAMEHFRAP